MEYIDIFDYNNNPTGEIKEKTQAHEDGNFHRTAHVWIMNDKKELLIQKRSSTKKSHPNFWDISGAGHIRAGETVIEGAIRELKEELGLEVKEEDLQYIATIKSTKNPKNMEVNIISGVPMEYPPNAKHNPVINPTVKFPIRGVDFNLYA